MASTPRSAASADDASLLVASRRGDHAAFAALVRRHERPVFAYLRSRLPWNADVEDLCQEVFVRLYTARTPAIDPAGAGLLPWLVGIARNVLREHVRRAQRRREFAWTELCLEIEERAGADEGWAGRHDDALTRLPKCLQALGPSARQAIDLYYGSDLSLRDVAVQLKRSEGAMKLLVHRARQAVKRCLDAGRSGGAA